jgi:hypothetical protein
MFVGHQAQRSLLIESRYPEGSRKKDLVATKMFSAHAAAIREGRNEEFLFLVMRFT